MSLVLGDNFSYQGAKPLDKRNQYDTVADMAAVSDTTLYNGCLTFCLETGKTYQWLSTNTVDATLGKWREFSSGGGGSSDLAGLDDVDITAAAAGQILKYDETEQKWVNSNQTIEIIEMSKAEFDELPTSEKNNGKAYFIPDAQGSEGGGGSSYTAGDGIVYSTDEQIVGTWIDGKPIYQKSYTGNIDNSIGWHSIDDDTTKVYISGSGAAIRSGGDILSIQYSNCISLGKVNNKLGYGILNQEGSDIFSGGTYNFTICYTKTTD